MSGARAFFYPVCLNGEKNRLGCAVKGQSKREGFF